MQNIMAIKSRTKRSSIIPQTEKLPTSSNQLELFGWDYQCKEIAEELVRASERVNKARDEYRQVVYNLAGCELDDWTLGELFKYVELGRKQFKIQ